MDGPETTADNTLAALLRGDSVPVEDGLETLIARARLHGVLPLLYARTASNWPREFAEECRYAALTTAAWELRHQVQIARTLESLHDANIETLVLKGTALAYSLYADASQRVRGDTDLLFREGARPSVHQSLLAQGWRAELAAPSNQTTYTCTTADGSRHVIDAHWRLNNSHLLSRTFEWNELSASSIALSRLSPHARGLGPVHAFLFASLHRCTHAANPYYVDDEAHHEPNRLIWLHDIKLLARELKEDDWMQLIALASQKELREVCLDTFRAAQLRVGAQIPEFVIPALTAPSAKEQVWHYMQAGRLQRHWMDARAIPSLAERARYARALLFPGADYMQHKYGHRGPQWLPYLYARRAIGGFVKALQRR